MRLSQSDIDGILAAISHFSPTKGSRLYLYGSRVDDTRKGGDIDLLLISDNLANDFDLKIKMIVKIKDHIGEQKIDLLIHTHKDCSLDPFLKMIFPTCVNLHEW